MIKKFNTNPSQKYIDTAIFELSNDKNNSVAHVYTNEQVKSSGQLAGVPITVKNIFATKDAVTDSSSKLLHNFEPGYNAHIIDLLRNNGASIVAKVNLDELGLGGTGLYSSYGIIKNPLDNTRIVGGSSSGSASTFTKNIGASIGSDTGDSIRIPASYVGCVGFKPSYGAISRRGLFPFASSLDTVSYLTHNVSDSAIISSVLFSKDSKDLTSRDVPFNLDNVKLTKPKKIAYLSLDKKLDTYVKDSFNKLVLLLEKQNIEIEYISVNNDLINILPTIYKIVSFSEVASNNSNLSGLLFGNKIQGTDWSDTMIKTRKSGFGVIPTTRMILGSAFLRKENQEIYLEKAQKIRGLIVKEFSKIFNEYDLLIFPTCGNIAPKISKDLFENSSVASINSYASSLLLIANFLGAPSISIPWGKYKDLPFGLNVNSKLYSDEKLLSHCLYLEKLIGAQHD